MEHVEIEDLHLYAGALSTMVHTVEQLERLQPGGSQALDTQHFLILVLALQLASDYLPTDNAALLPAVLPDFDGNIGRDQNSAAPNCDESASLLDDLFRDLLFKLRNVDFFGYRERGLVGDSDSVNHVDSSQSSDGGSSVGPIVAEAADGVGVRGVGSVSSASPTPSLVWEAGQ